MKKTILLALLVLFSYSINAQTASKDSKGNYIQVASKAKTKAKAIDTGKTYTTNKGEVFKVYKTEKDRLFIIRTSAKTGKTYNQYLKIQN